MNSSGLRPEIVSVLEVVLTPHEEQTVSLVTDGLNDREIANELNVKENTVKKSLLQI